MRVRVFSVTWFRVCLTSGRIPLVGSLQVCSFVRPGTFVAPRLGAADKAGGSSALLDPDVPLPLDEISERKKQILEQECHGLIEVISPDHGFDVVGGMEPIKKALIVLLDT